ncbi:polysaccharide deacetylase family protein [candidate division KSB1 bacterium]|nr:polysaccharide deacetylase family protein [candidate division KSB1 bacterium]
MRILAYHMVEPRFDVSVTRVTPKQFGRQIETALQLGYRFRTLAQALTHPYKDEKTIVLTFDDGYASVYQHAFPILRACTIPATIFIIVDYIGKLDTWDVNFGNICFPHLSWREIEALAAAGWEIGSHGLTHRDLTRLNREEQYEELYRSKANLEQTLTLTIDSISYPFGRVNPSISHLCREIGYRRGVVMGRRCRDVDVDFCLGRQGIYLFDGIRLFRQKIVAKNIKMLNFMQRCIDYCSMGTVIVKQGPWSKHENCA